MNFKSINQSTINWLCPYLEVVSWLAGVWSHSFLGPEIKAFIGPVPVPEIRQVVQIPSGLNEEK